MFSRHGTVFHFLDLSNDIKGKKKQVSKPRPGIYARTYDRKKIRLGLIKDTQPYRAVKLSFVAHGNGWAKRKTKKPSKVNPRGKITDIDMENEEHKI